MEAGGSPCTDSNATVVGSPASTRSDRRKEIDTKPERVLKTRAGKGGKAASGGWGGRKKQWLIMLGMGLWRSVSVGASQALEAISKGQGASVKREAQRSEGATSTYQTTEALAGGHCCMGTIAEALSDTIAWAGVLGGASLGTRYEAVSPPICGTRLSVHFGPSSTSGIIPAFRRAVR